jgi:hypothetical protein
MRYIGPEIPTLNEGWSFLGAKLEEWLAGAGCALLYLSIIQLYVRPLEGRDGAVIIAIIVGLAYLLKYFRQKYPDEKRGMINNFCDLVGFPPPLIPKPASFQPYWSGNRVRDIRNTEFAVRGFDKIFFYKDAKKVKPTKILANNRDLQS